MNHAVEKYHLSYKEAAPTYSETEVRSLTRKPPCKAVEVRHSFVSILFAVVRT